VAVPGLIDLHVHLREPGNEAAETVASGSQAAARGGFTTIVAMPNTNPALDCPAEVAALSARATAANLARVLPAPCITVERAGHALADIEALSRAGAIAFTDDGCTVTNPTLMEEAMRRAAAVGHPLMDHALDPRLAGKGVMHEGPRSKALNLPGIPSEAETTIVARDIHLAETTGGAIHIQHLSSGESVDLIRDAQRRGLRVTAELTPHHLALTDDDVRADQPALFKMNPPLGSHADRESLVRGIIDGTIACFATDHAPHTAKSKALGFAGAPFGVIGLETAVGVTFSFLVRKGLLSLRDWVARWTTGPAAILGLPTPSLAIGCPANLTLLDLNSEWTVHSDSFASKSRNCPFDGWTLHGQATHTFRNGHIIFSRESKIFNPPLPESHGSRLTAHTSSPNIILMGFMGTGKTTVGKKLAEKLNMEFLDMDHVIEARAGKPISRIFAEEGEPHFRKLERELTMELSARQGLVVGCGGGVVLNPDNISDYQKTGLVVCLTASPETIFKRTAKHSHRPLLEEKDRKQRIIDLLGKRRSLYASIPHQIDTDALPPAQVVKAILSLFKKSQ
jgi:dihydroorotase